MSEHPTTADRIRPWAVLIALPVTLAMAALGAGLLGGTAIQDSSSGALSADATPLAPGSGAFRIWSVIYLGLAVYAVWQVLPRNRADERQRATGWLAVASLVLNALWITVAQLGLLWLTVVVMLLLLAVLCLIFDRLVRARAGSWLEAIVVDGTFGLYLGWVSVATVANIAAWLADLGVRPAAYEVPAIVVLVVAALVAVAIALRGGGRVAPAAAMIWGIGWIGTARWLGEPRSEAIAIAAWILCVVILLVTIAIRQRSVEPRPARPGVPLGR